MKNFFTKHAPLKLFLLLLAASHSSFAAPNPLKVVFDAKNDLAPSYIYDIYVLVDSQNNLTGMGYMNHATRERTDWTLPQVETGMEISHPLGIELGSFQAKDLDPRSGGRINFKYRSRLFPGAFSDFYMNLVRVNDQWKVENADSRQQFNHIMFRVSGNHIESVDLTWTE